jgi:phosphoserine phosphatase RsbU/P
MSDLAQNPLQHPLPASLREFGQRIRFLALLRKEVASNGEAWLPFVMVVGAIAAVAYADHRVTSVSLVYLYMLPLAVGAIFLRRAISYSLIVVCMLLHDYYSPRPIHLEVRVFHQLSAMLCFAFVVYLIQRYIEEREALAKTVEQQRDDLLKDVELAAQVQRLFLPSGKAAIAGLDVAGMMLPARGVGGDYYDYFPVDEGVTQIIVADVAGKGVPAALLMSATAAALRLEANRDRDMLEQVQRLNTEIGAVSHPDAYVTLMLSKIDVRERTVQYVNCGHNSALLFHASTGALTHLSSSCLPIGLSPEEICELASEDLMPGDVLVFYTDGVIEAQNQAGEEFGMKRLSAAVLRGASLSADDLMTSIYNASADFCGDEFNDDVTIVVVKCNFDGSLADNS